MTRPGRAAAATAVAGFPLPLRAQAKTFKVGVVHPVTGPLAEPGQACWLGAQMAADAINAAGEQNVLRALRLCARAYVLENGTVTLAGTREALLADEGVKRAYLGH